MHGIKNNYICEVMNSVKIYDSIKMFFNFIKFNFVKFLVINSRKIWISLNIVFILFYLSIIKNNDMRIDFEELPEKPNRP
jgi:hypothetical protein